MTFCHSSHANIPSVISGHFCKLMTSYDVSVMLFDKYSAYKAELLVVVCGFSWLILCSISTGDCSLAIIPTVASVCLLSN